MDVCVKLLADDVWAAEDNKTYFLSVEVNIFGQIYLKEQSISLPMVPTSTIKRKYEKWGWLRKLNKSKYVIVLMNDQNIMFGYTPPMERLENRKSQSITFDECSNIILDRTLST